MKVYTHYTDRFGGIRFGTLLQFGDSWNLIGSVVMKNPGSAYSPDKMPIPEYEIPEGLKQYDDYPHELWYEFRPDSTMHCIESLFSNCGEKRLSGVVLIFNLMYVMSADLKAALGKQESSDFVIDDVSVLKKYINKPVYLGWGSLSKNKSFAGKAREIEGIVSERWPQIDFAPFNYPHPQYLMLYGKNQPKCIELRKLFCKV